MLTSSPYLPSNGVTLTKTGVIHRINAEHICIFINYSANFKI